MMKQILTMNLILLSVFAVNGQTKNNKIVGEIKQMDAQWQVESYSSIDLKDFNRVVAEDFSITGSNGKLLTKAQKCANVKNDYTDPATVAPDFTFKIDEASHQVRIFKNTAISNGYIIEKYDYKGTKINNRVYFTCTYLKRGARWQVVAAQYTNIKQS